MKITVHITAAAKVAGIPAAELFSSVAEYCGNNPNPDRRAVAVCVNSILGGAPMDNWAAATAHRALVDAAAAAFVADYWSAPANLAALQERGGSSSWSTFRSPNGQWAVQPLNHEPAEFAAIKAGRTAGRALRNTRRFLAANPIPFGGAK